MTVYDLIVAGLERIIRDLRPEPYSSFGRLVYKCFNVYRDVAGRPTSAPHREL